MGIRNSILNWWQNRGLKDYRILMLGLDNAGKTTILYRLKLNKTIATIPTLGFNIESIPIGDNVNLTVWDVGGHAARRMYRHYTVNTYGKSSILYKLKLGEVVTTIPTIGFNVESLNIEGLKITVWDVGGQGRIRVLWRHYIPNTDGLIYVVDSTDTERLVEAKEELDSILDFEDMRGVPVLILANKQDMQDVLTARKIVKEMDLTRLDDRQWYVQNASAKTGEGLTDAMKQFATMVKDFKANNS